MDTAPKGRVLIVAGSDPSGGAGIQADIKTVTAIGGYAAAVLTALTVQNTVAVTDVMAVAPSFVADQMMAVLDDIGADCIKTGMLHSVGCVESVASVIRDMDFQGDVIADPVMVATSGNRLLETEAVECIKKELIPLATVLTPNTLEAELLTGCTIRNVDDMRHAGEILLEMGARSVVMKGGHLAGSELTDILLTSCGHSVEITSKKIDTRHTHGTGCTFASAVATLLAQGQTLDDAFENAHTFVRKAIECAPGFGEGNGPLGHAEAGRL